MLLNVEKIQLIKDLCNEKLLKNKKYIPKGEYGCWYCDWKLRLKVYKNKKQKLKEKE